MDEPMVVTTVRVPRRVWALLRALSEEKALEVGGRPSVSGVIVELAEQAAQSGRKGQEAPRG